MLGKEFTINEIADIVSASVEGAGSLGIITQIATDSRFLGIGESTLFIALRTERNDGHRFIADAYKKGVRFFLVDKDSDSNGIEDAIFLKCENPLKALQQLAGHYRNTLDFPLIGITGSNGKTVVKEWLFQLLSTIKNTGRSPKSYNSQIGVPISLLLLPQSLDIGIIEAGISQPGEMSMLYDMIHPEIGIITNAHGAHLENFVDRLTLVKEKLKLFDSCETIFYCRDYELIHDELKNNSCTDKISWSSKKELQPDVLVQIDVKEKFTSITIPWNGLKCAFTVSLTDQASIENAVFCVLTALKMGVSIDQVTGIMPGLHHVAMRLQQIEGINKCTVINDVYNSDLTSLEIALNFLNMQGQHAKKTLILSDIIQSGIESEQLFKRVNELCVRNKIDRIICIGPEIGKYLHLFTMESDHFNSTGDFLKDINAYAFFDETILLKGSRRFEFERISRQLAYKKHETSLNVNLSAMIENLGYYKSRLNSETKMMVMVKAFSYGTGSYEVANVLQHHGIDYLAVAYVDEGINLRKNGISLPIMVMNPAMGGLDEMMQYDLEPEIFSLNSLKIVDGFTRNTGKKFNIHLKVETGMHRLGIEFENLGKTAEILAGNNSLVVRSVFSHLLASDDPLKDEISKHQVNALDSFCDSLEKSLGKKVMRHILNSDGISRFPEYQKDMVRLGIGLYGISSIPEVRNHLKPVVTLKSIISQIKELEAGQGVGYGSRFVAPHRMKSATVPVGYADGLTRELGNGNWSLSVNDRLAPIIGNVCMDMCMIDVSDLENVMERDEVLIIGPQNDVYEMAEKRKTIPYEILTSFSERVKRIFYYGE